MAATALNTVSQLNGAVSASSDTAMTITVTEMLLGSTYVKFNPAKELTIAVTEYSTTELADSELAVAKKLANKGGQATTLTDVEKVAAASLDAKIK